MIDLIEKKRLELEELCRRCQVKTLELFGSATDQTFDPARSDLDFLVEYLPLADGQHARAYFDLLHGLEDLFQRKIDLVMVRAIKNPFFRKAVERSRKVIYAA